MRYWMVKTEPTVYSIDNLKRDRITAWDRVRNYQARNYLREMKKGDRVLVYHSSCGDGTGVVGEASVHTVAYADPSQFDKRSEYFDPKATQDQPRWFCPDLTFTRKFVAPIGLEVLREARGLKGLMLLRPGNRLSVMPLEEREFNIIVSLGENCAEAQDAR